MLRIQDLEEIPRSWWSKPPLWWDSSNESTWRDSRVFQVGGWITWYSGSEDRVSELPQSKAKHTNVVVKTKRSTPIPQWCWGTRASITTQRPDYTKRPMSKTSHWDCASNRGLSRPWRLDSSTRSLQVLVGCYWRAWHFHEYVVIASSLDSETKLGAYLDDRASLKPEKPTGKLSNSSQKVAPAEIWILPFYYDIWT